MINRQYILSQKELENISDEFECIKFDSLFIYKHHALESYKSNFESNSILLFGFIIDPLKPEKSSKEITNDLVKFPTKESLFEYIEHLSGRYIVLYKNEKDFILFHDMFGQRQLNYTIIDEHIFISSSVKLLVETTQKGINFIPNYKELLEDKKFQLLDHWFLGDLTWDRDVKKLLPNHYLDINSSKIFRIPFYAIPIMSEKEVIEYCHTILKGNYNAVCQRYTQIHQALTSGYDSRTLLSFSQEHWNLIQFYTFYRGDTNSGRDRKIAHKLSKKFNFNYKTISKLERDPDFEKNYKSQFITPRTSPKFYNILHFSKLSNSKTINITGDGVQMVRNLRSPAQLDSALTLFDSLGYSHHKYHLENFSNWLETAQTIAKENEIYTSDLFTQEIAQGQLTARWSHEFDLSNCEEFNPFNHKRMIYSILKNIPYEQRISPHYIFQKKLMESSLEGVSEIPFNPPTWKDKVKKLIKR